MLSRVDLLWRNKRMDLDRTGLHILAALRREGRLINVELAARIALSP